MVTTVFKVVVSGVGGGDPSQCHWKNHSVIYEICVAMASFRSPHKLLMCQASCSRNTIITIASISRAVSMCLTVCLISILTLNAHNTLADKHLTTSRLCRKTLKTEKFKELSWEQSKYFSDCLIAKLQHFLFLKFLLWLSLFQLSSINILKNGFASQELFSSRWEPESSVFA